MAKKIYKNIEIKDFILHLGSELAELKYVWSDEVKEKV